MPFSTYAQDKINDHTFRHVAWTSPTTVYVALYTGITSRPLCTGTEVSAAGYARVAVTFGASSGGVVATSGTTTMGPPSADWGVVTDFGLFDASTAGNGLIALTALAASKTINNGDTVTFAVGALTFTIA